MNYSGSTIEVGQKFYRFKIEIYEGDVEISHITFKVSDLVEIKRGTDLYAGVTLVCLENPKIKYKDSKDHIFENLDVGKAKSSGNAIYVMLEEYNQDRVLFLVREYLQRKVDEAKERLEKEQAKFNTFMNFEACASGYSSSL